MNAKVARAVLIVAQSSTFVIMLGYIAFRSALVVLPTFLALLVLMRSKCGQCGTSFRDERVYDRFQILKFYDTAILDDCPVCHRSMFPE